MASKSKLSSLLKGKSVPNLPSYSTPWSKHDEKLWNAIKQQNIKIVKAALTKASVTPTKLGPQGKSAFHLACEIGNEQIIDVILASTQDVNDTTLQGVTALHRAAAKGHTSTVNKLLKKQANVDQRDCDCMTALHHACFWQHQDCVKALLLKNADVNAVEQSGKTPLFYSAHLGHIEICMWLLDKGANVNCQDKDNVTPLMLAAKEGHQNVCELLLERGANQELIDRYGKTALHYATVFKHSELQEVLHKAHRRISSTSLNDCRERTRPFVHSTRANPSPLTQIVYSTESTLTLKNSDHDAHSINSMDDSMLSVSDYLPPQFLSAGAQPSILQTSSADETEPKSLYSSEGDETVAKTMYSSKADETEPKSLYSSEDTDLQKQKKTEALKLGEQTFLKQIAADGDNPIIDNTYKKEFMQETNESDDKSLDVETETEKLKDTMLMKRKISSDRNSQHLISVKDHFLEKEQLEKQITQLKEQLEKQQLKGIIDQEELIQQNKSLTKEVESLRQAVVSLKEELEVTKSEVPTDAQRLDAILAVSGTFEEVNFDEEGFVEGRDMTKEEFLQAQNQQLKIQCGHLTEELEKLRLTFDAILKAGDNLQADYDHLVMEKDALQDELEVTLKEKRDVVAENEFLLTDNNELHENLKKIVHELEKMQEKYQTAQSENEELKRSVAVASKVGEVARLLEERDVLQQKCADLESTSQKLQHDHDILVEEVQSLNESVNQLTGQRNQLVADLEEMETFYQQHETLQAEYSQLEMEFAELLKDKEALEQQLSNNNEVKEETKVKVSSETSLEKSLKQLAAEKQQVEDEKQKLQGVVNGLTRHIVATENKVKDLEKDLIQLRAAQISHQRNVLLERNGIENDDENNKGDELNPNQEEIINLKKQIVQLTQEVEEWEKKHADTVSTYRTHLLSAVQGHMDPDVKDALYHIIELRSMEQFC